MGLFSKLFGGSPEAEKNKDETIEYNGYSITPKPVKAAGGYRVGAIITREKDGQTLTHEMIRSDVIQSHEEALKISEMKAKITVDQLGDDIFKPRT